MSWRATEQNRSVLLTQLDNIELKWRVYSIYCYWSAQFIAQKPGGDMKSKKKFVVKRANIWKRKVNNDNFSKVFLIMVFAEKRTWLKISEESKSHKSRCEKYNNQNSVSLFDLAIH